MKELSHIAFNTLASIGSGRFIPQSEVILVLSEPSYVPAPDGSAEELAKLRTHETVRFTADARVLRALCDSLTREADRIERDVSAAAHAHHLPETSPS